MLLEPSSHITASQPVGNKVTQLQSKEPLAQPQISVKCSLWFWLHLLLTHSLGSQLRISKSLSVSPSYRSTKFQVKKCSRLHTKQRYFLVFACMGQTLRIHQPPRQACSLIEVIMKRDLNAVKCQEQGAMGGLKIGTVPHLGFRRICCKRVRLRLNS